MSGAVGRSGHGIEITLQLKVGDVDGLLPATGEDRDYSRVGGCVKKGEQIVNEAKTGVVAKSVGDVYSFRRI